MFRRDIRAALKRREQDIQKLIPPLDTYLMLREAFRGGDTHASRFYAGKILPGPIRSVDRSSSYPDVQCNGKFPMSIFYNPEPQDAHSIDAVISKMKKKYAILARLIFRGIRLRSMTNPNPYISDDKCRNVFRAAYDNGRIMSAEYLEITVTDEDLFIILHDYDWDGKIEVVKWQYARLGPLPEEMVRCIEEYYVMKTELKNVEGQELYYEKSKNKLNSLFGCSSQDPVKYSIRYTEGGDYIEGALIDGVFNPRVLEDGTEVDYTGVLLDQAEPVMPYQWGVW